MEFQGIDPQTGRPQFGWLDGTFSQKASHFIFWRDCLGILSELNSTQLNLTQPVSEVMLYVLRIVLRYIVDLGGKLFHKVCCFYDTLLGLVGQSE